MPVLPDALSKQLPATKPPVLEAKSSDCSSNFYQATYLRRAAEQFFTGEESSIHNSKITPGDPFQLVEKEEVSLSKWHVVLLLPQRVNKQIEFSFLQGLKKYFT